MAAENFSIEESDFDDAIIEIANEIAQIHAIKTAAVPLKSDPQIALKVEMELKKAESPSMNFFRVLKTLQEVQVYSGNVPSAAPCTPSTTERKYIPRSKGSDQKYHALTITETVIVNEEILDYHSPTLEELFEDPESEEKPSVLISQKKKSLETGSVILDNDSQPPLPPADKIAEKIVIKSVNIPNTISNNISRQLKKNERDIFKNLLKMQKK